MTREHARRFWTRGTAVRVREHAPSRGDRPSAGAPSAVYEGTLPTGTVTDSSRLATQPHITTHLSQHECHTPHGDIPSEE
ncbi:hypothetical protein GN956_G24196 [Arapaima gigas]